MKEPLEIKVGPGRNLRRLLMILGAGAFVGFCVAVAGIYCRVFSPGGNFIDTRALIVIGLVLVILFTAIMPLIPFFSDFAFNRLRLYDDRLELTSLAYGRIQCARKKTFPRTAISEVFISADDDSNTLDFSFGRCDKDKFSVLWYNGYEGYTVLKGFPEATAKSVRDKLAAELPAKPPFKCPKCGVESATSDSGWGGDAVRCPSCGERYPLQYAEAYRQALFYVKETPEGVAVKRNAFTYCEQRFRNRAYQALKVFLVFPIILTPNIISAIQKFIAGETSFPMSWKAAGQAIWPAIAIGFYAYCLAKSIASLVAMLRGRYARYSITMKDGYATYEYTFLGHVQRHSFKYDRYTGFILPPDKPEEIRVFRCEDVWGANGPTFEELPEKLFIGCPLSLYTWAIAWMRIEGAKVEPSTVH